MKLNGRVILLAAALFSAGIAIGVHAAAVKPGEEAYQVTRLEWAATQMAIESGQNVPFAEHPVMISFAEQPDGQTLLCTIQYFSGRKPGTLKRALATITHNFEALRNRLGWPWLKLQFKEQAFEDLNQ